jgi:four helix bundle protein
MDRVAEALKTRTKYFAVRVLEFVETLPRSPGGDAVAKQLARSGLGVVGNYRSSCRARSHAEFTARLGIVLEEADESELWTEVTADRGWGDAAKREWLSTKAVNSERSSPRP